MKRDQLAGLSDLDERMQQAVNELQAMILSRYPETRFELALDPDDPASIHLIAIADVDDPDEVGNLVVDRVVDLIVDEGIPVHVIPVRSPERRQVALANERRMVSQRSVHTG